MIQKPKHFAPKHAESFKDFGVVETYHYRPPYPPETFDILTGLINTEMGISHRVLDVGCGIGYIARPLVERVNQVDAVDFSQYMIAKGKHLPNGDNPRLHWLHGAIEDIALNPPYVLITAGDSLHWMDWERVLPRFHDVLVPGCYLAILEHEAIPYPWSMLSEIIPHYSTNKDYQDFDMIDALEQHGLFCKVGAKTTAPVPFTQSIDDYIESYHSRSGFSRERMGQEQADAFDQEARKILLKKYSDGVIELNVIANIVWGLPLG
jgi:SAM-dependent methyltransferase